MTTITRARAQRIDFTQPRFDAGLRILVNQDQSAGFRDLVAGLRESGHLRALLCGRIAAIVGDAS